MNARQNNFFYREAMRAGDWEEAARMLNGTSEARKRNDLAVCLHQAGRLADAVEVLKKADQADLPAILKLNLFYMERALRIQQGFDSSWGHKDHDGAACPESPPLVSVIVRTYKRTDLLAQALDSLRNQTFTEFETIVVNDGGDPAAEQVVGKSGLGRTRYAMLPHRGRVHTLNAGLEMAHGKYVTGLDDDDIAYPHHLETLVSAIEKENIKAAYAGFRRKGLDDQSSGGGKVLWTEDRKGEKQKPENLCHTNTVPSVMIMSRLECFREAGRFCPDLDLGEDWEMWLRLHERFGLHHIPEVTAEIRERPGPANITYRRLRQKYLWDNTLLYLHRCIVLSSFPRDPRLEKPYCKAMEMLDRVMEEHPEIEELLNLRGLWDMRKPYHWFADQARWFRQIGEAGLARRLSRMAARLSPFEPKLWAGILRPGPAKTGNV